MDHPILSINDFAEHCGRRADDWGFEDCAMVNLEPSGRIRWDGARTESGVKINDGAVIGCQDSALKNSPFGLFTARWDGLAQNSWYGAASLMVDHAWG